MRQETKLLHASLCCRLDAVVRTVQDAVALGRACPSMVLLVQALDAAGQHLDCEALEAAAEAFERAFPRLDLDNHTSAPGPVQPTPATSGLTVSGEHQDDDSDASVGPVGPAGPAAAQSSDGFTRSTPDRPGTDLLAERID
ncbi:Charged multivesicular body protein 1b [Frankliniella fusca]|uniref:Charged multivesicular body protein 1b n=1 Tax=Frankliniella fusca TaxID=407009 RepID=A0AAE1HKC5_9NEOP|nr:Charged multivesicular body protein 1b [Frankliniella fusca]